MSRIHKAGSQASPTIPPISLPMPEALRLKIFSLESRAGKLRIEAEEMKRGIPSFLQHSVSKVGNARRNDLEAQGIDNFVNSIERSRAYHHSIKREVAMKVKEAERCERKAGKAREKLVALEKPALRHC